MAISAADVKKLREMTGAGMMDCKKALTETDGDFDAAIEFLRKKGLATAEKKAGRIAAEGIVSTVVSADGKNAVIIEVNSETDFVAKNAVFQEYVTALATQILNNDYADLAAFTAAKSDIDPTATVEEHHKAMVAKIGENLTKINNIRDSAIMIISHQERILNIADEIVVLAEGRVEKQGPREEILPGLIGTASAVAGCRKAI